MANFETLSTSTWNTRRFDFEHYPTAVIPWNMGSTTPIYSDEVDKVQVGSGDFVFFLPVLLLLGTIVVLGIVSKIWDKHPNIETFSKNNLLSW